MFGTAPDQLFAYSVELGLHTAFLAGTDGITVDLEALYRLVVGAGQYVIDSPDVFLAFVLWQLALLYTVPVVFWDFELGVLWYRNRQNRKRRLPEVAWELDSVQVRIVTIDNADVVQQTIDSLPTAVDDIVVIAERPINVTGAEVLAVPPEFECTASHKGRAVEWARRHHPTEREYVLYLDEDTDASGLTGIASNADIVQFRERPVRTGGLLPFLAEVHRIGFNVEQRSFPFFRLPFYAWGGGIAIRSSLEERVTWDTPTLVEDSVFAWRAVLDHEATIDIVDTYLANQAPPSVWTMIRQRQRWLTGTRERQAMLPFQYRMLYDLRDLGWALSTFGPVLWLLSALSFAGVIELSLLPVFFPEAYLVLTVTLLAHVYAWSVIGLLIYRPPASVWLFLLAFTPFIVTVHSIGALYGLVHPARTFTVTRKVTSGGESGAQSDGSASNSTPDDGTRERETAEPEGT